MTFNDLQRPWAPEANVDWYGEILPASPPLPFPPLRNRPLPCPPLPCPPLPSPPLSCPPVPSLTLPLEVGPLKSS